MDDDAVADKRMRDRCAGPYKAVAADGDAVPHHRTGRDPGAPADLRFGPNDRAGLDNCSLFNPRACVDERRQPRLLPTFGCPASGKNSSSDLAKDRYGSLEISGTVRSGTRSAEAGATNTAAARVSLSAARYFRFSKNETSSLPASSSAFTALIGLPASAEKRSGISAPA